MKAKLYTSARLFLLAAMLLTAAAVPAKATTLPTVAAGDPVAGIFTLDPSTPLLVLSSGGFFDWLNRGSIALVIGGRMFAAPIDNVLARPLSFWALNTGQGTVDGEPITLSMNLSVSNPSGSISLFPPPLTEPPPNQNLNLLQMIAFSCVIPAVPVPSSSLCEHVNYNVNITALDQVGSTGAFTFSGTIAPVSFAAVPGPVVGAGLPGILFAGGGLLAWWRKRRNHAAAITACFAILRTQNEQNHQAMMAGSSLRSPCLRLEPRPRQRRRRLFV